MPRHTAKSPQTSFLRGSSVSFNGHVSANERAPSAAATANIASIPHSTASTLPSAGPPAIPALPATPSHPIAAPRRSTGTMSAVYAVAPVGRNPALIP